METDFLYNDFTTLNKGELESVVKNIDKKATPVDPKAAFLKKFTIEVFNAYRRGKIQKKVVIEEKPKEEIRMVERPIIKPEIKKIVLEDAPRPVFKKVLSTREIINDEGVIVKAAYNNGVYNLIEPKLEDKDINFLKVLEKEVGKKIIKNKNLFNQKDFVKNETDKLAKKIKFSVPLGYYDKLHYFLTRDLINFGKIDGLLRDVEVKEIICDGLNKPLRINFKGEEAITDVVFSNKTELDNIIIKFAELAGKKISSKEPFLSATLSSGLKIQASSSSNLNDARFVIKK